MFRRCDLCMRAIHIRSLGCQGFLFQPGQNGAFRVKLLGHGGRTGDVAEEDRNKPALAVHAVGSTGGLHFDGIFFGDRAGGTGFSHLLLNLESAPSHSGGARTASSS